MAVGNLSLTHSPSRFVCSFCWLACCSHCGDGNQIYHTDRSIHNNYTVRFKELFSLASKLSRLASREGREEGTCHNNGGHFRSRRALGLQSKSSHPCTGHENMAINYFYFEGRLRADEKPDVMLGTIVAHFMEPQEALGWIIPARQNGCLLWGPQIPQGPQTPESL